MAYNFPNSPAVNDVFLDYKWDGAKWCLAVGGIPDTSTWTPASLTGLIGWWDAQVFASITGISGGGPQYPMSTILDQSGAGNTLSGGGANYNATLVNGLPGLIFYPALGNGLNKTSFALGTGNTLTAWVVGAISSSGSGQIAYGRFMSYTAAGATHDYDNNGSFIMMRDASTSNATFVRNGSPTSQGNGYFATLRMIATVKSDGTVTFYLNGVPTTYAGAVANWVSAGRIYIGGSQFDSSVSVGGQLNGNIGEAGIATSYSDAATVALLDTYLMNRWAMNPVTNFLARTSGLDTTHRDAYTALINGLVADGVWAKLDALYIYATADQTTALLNLVSATYNSTKTGTPTFTADRGYTGTDSSNTVYIDTNFAPSSATSPKFIQNSAHISLWGTSGVASSAQFTMGNFASSNLTAISARETSNVTGFSVNAAATITVANTDTSGHFIANRSSSTAMQGYKNGSSVVTSGVSASVAVNNINLVTLAYNNAGTRFGSNVPTSAASIGSSLTSGEALAFYNRLRTYMTAVGVP